MIYCFLTVYVFLGDYHGLIDFVRLLKVILKDKTSDYVVIAMDERLFTDDPATYFAKSKIIKVSLLSLLHLDPFSFSYFSHENIFQLYASTFDVYWKKNISTYCHTPSICNKKFDEIRTFENSVISNV